MNVINVRTEVQNLPVISKASEINVISSAAAKQPNATLAVEVMKKKSTIQALPDELDRASP